MRKFINLVALAALLFVPWVANAQNTLTVADGTSTNGFVPVYGYYADAYLRSQVVYPANDIAAATTTAGMNGGSITSLTYYTEQSSVSLSATFTVKMMEIAGTTLSSFQDMSSATQVYSGAVTIANGEMTITFDSPYTYNGGNLLIEFASASTGNYSQTTFYGIDQSGASVQGYDYSSVSGVNATQRNFIPKTTFTFTGGTTVTCPAVQGHSVTNLTSDGGTLNIIDTMNTGASYSISYWKLGSTDTTTVSSSTTSYTFSGLDANSRYYYTVTAVCSANDQSVALGGSFVTICGSSTCEITVTSAGEYSGTYYSPTLTVSQNGIEMASVCGSTEVVSVCSSDTVVVLYTDANYSWGSRSATILDGGGAELFNGATTAYSTGDTLLSIATPCPSCIPPTALTAESSLDQIVFSWTPRSGASQFVVYLDNTLVSNNVTDTFYTFTGLDANTLYTLGVQSACAADDSSSIASIDARTSCGAITLPFSDDFDSYADGFWPPCWHRLRAYGTDPSVNAQYHHSGTQSMFLLAVNDTTLFCTPDAIPTAGNNIYVRYHAFLNWASYYTENKWIKAGVMTDTADMSTFIALDSVEYHNFNDVFEEREFNTAALDPTETYWVAWMFYSSNNGYGSYNRGAIDDVYISEIPSCLRVESISTDIITDESITLTWVDNANTGANYTVSYWTAVSDTTTVTTGDTSYVFTELSANTQYFFSVQVNCGSDDAEAVTASFRTACGATPIPFMEGFDDAGSLSCWQVHYPTYSTGYSASNGRTSNGCFLFYYTTDPPEYLISPELTGTDNGLKLEFYYKQYSTSFPESFKVGYSTTSDSINAFTWGEEVTNASGSYQLYSTIMPAGVKYVAIQYTANNMYGVYIDDFNFMLPPDCMPAYNLTVDDITATSATLHWTAPEGQNNFIVRLDSTDYNVAADTSYTFSNLEARTSYTAYVATDCGGDTAEFVPITFMTDCSTGSCEIIVTATASYSYSSYCPTVHVWQNGADVASVNASTDTINVCSGMPVALIYEAPQYTYYTPSVTILNGGDDEVFNGSTSNYSTGDTLVVMANACPSCVKPTGVMATSIDSAEISFVWNVDASVESYLISLNGDDETVGYNGNEFYTGLTPNTTYTFSVRAVCAPGDTSNARVITVKTACGEMAIPYIEGFEGNADGEVPSCWNAITGAPTVDSYASYAHTGNNSLSMGYGTDMIATSRVPLPGDSIYVSFWANLSAGLLEVGVMTNPLFDTTFIPILTINSTSGYELFEFNTSTLSHDSSYYVAFRYFAPYNSVNIDDINIRLDEGCMYPSNVVATPSINNVTLSWNYTGSVNDFAVEYRTGTATSWTATAGTSSNSITINGLASSSNYEARVGNICGNDTLWTYVTFQTSCDMVGVPYYENFYSATMDLPPCWDFTDPSKFGFNNWIIDPVDGHGYSGPGDGTMMAKQNSAYEYAILPEFNAPFSKLQISFKAKLGNISEGDSMVFGVYDAVTDNITIAGKMANPNQSREVPVVFTYNFLNYTGSGNRIAISHSHNNSNDWGFEIDSVVVIALPDCFPPTDVTAHNSLYPNTAADVYFTWNRQGEANQWQVYLDTVTSTIDIDSVPESQLITVYDTVYYPDFGVMADGAKYRFFVRSKCNYQMYSNWVELQNGVGTDEVWMNNSSVADTVVGCNFIVYDNGGPVAGYLHNSNSKLVILSGEDGRQPQVTGARIKLGEHTPNLAIYDGTTDSGTPLYSISQIGADLTIDTVIATSTTGALTVVFTSGYAASAGYELYVHCQGEASCPFPTDLNAVMTSESSATATWNGTASSYNFYYRIAESDTWVNIPTTADSVTLTGLIPDTVYDMYVVAICGVGDTSVPSPIRHLSTTIVVPEVPCLAPTNVMASNITINGAVISWTNGDTETSWNLEVNGNLISNVTTNPYTLTGLTPATQYTVKVQAFCDETHQSNWSTACTFTTEQENPEIPYYNVTVVSNNSTMGTVTGGGTYAENTVIEIRAISNTGYHFDHWNDNVTDSVRSITVTSDMNFTAYFASNSTGIDDVDASSIALYPNPASTTVTLSGIEGVATVTVVDMNGRENGKWTVNNGKLTIDLTGYAQGAYFVRIVGDQMNAIRKLIVK